MKTLGCLVLLLLLQLGDAPPTPVTNALDFLVRHQMPNGAWGGTISGCKCEIKGKASEPAVEGDVETTSWALVALMGAGYSEMSKDKRSGKVMGAVVKGGLDWLIGRQSQEGGFEGIPPESGALGALALINAHVWTALRKEPAEKAAAWVLKQTSTDVRARVRQGMAIQTAKLAEFPGDHEGRLRELVTALSAQKGTSAAIGSLFLDACLKWKSKDKPVVPYKEFDPATLSTEDLNALAWASFQVDGGELWHAWFDGIAKRLGALQSRTEKSCEEGSWARSSLRDRLKESSLCCLALEHYRCEYCKSKMFRQEK